MREFNIPLKEIFSGLDSAEYPDKTIPNVSTCLNLVPTGTTYNLHEDITDLNSVNPVTSTTPSADVWKDHGGDDWEDYAGDVWKDHPEYA